MTAAVYRKKERKKAACDKAIIMRDSSPSLLFCLQHKPGRFAILHKDQQHMKIKGSSPYKSALMLWCTLARLYASRLELAVPSPSHPSLQEL